MRNIVVGSEKDLLWNWARAELDSTRFGEMFRRWIPDELQAKVAEVSSGPFIVLEGYTRLTAMTSLFKAGKIDPETIPVLLGISPRLKEWHLYSSLNGRRTPKSLF